MTAISSAFEVEEVRETKLVQVVRAQSHNREEVEHHPSRSG